METNGPQIKSSHAPLVSERGKKKSKILKPIRSTFENVHLRMLSIFDQEVLEVLEHLK